jgi:hypothetical protein
MAKQAMAKSRRSKEKDEARQAKADAKQGIAKAEERQLKERGNSM